MKADPVMTVAVFHYHQMVQRDGLITRMIPDGRVEARS